MPESTAEARVIRSPEVAVPAVIATVLLCAAYVGSSYNRYLINDDYLNLYTAWLKSQGKVPGRDYFIGHSYLLPDLVAPLFKFGGGALFPLYATRLVSIGVIVAIAFLLYRVATRVFTPITGFLTPVVLLSTAALLHRGLDLRPELLIAFFWLAIVNLLLSPRLFSADASLGVGLLLGVACINEFKAVVMVPGMALVYVSTAWRGFTTVTSRTRALARSAGFAVLGSTLAFLTYFIWLYRTDDVHYFFQTNASLYGRMSEASRLAEGALADTLTASVRVDMLFWLLCFVGLWLRFKHARRYELRENVVCVAIFFTSLLSIALNPAYYVYNLVTLHSLLAPFAAFPLAILFERIQGKEGRRGFARVAGALVVMGPAFVHAPLAVTLATKPTNGHQLALAEFIRRYTPNDAAVFALEGVGLYRRSTYHWSFPWILIGRYRKAEWSFAEEFAASRPEIVILSYRVPGWLNSTDQSFLATHYVPLAPLILVPGYEVASGEASFELLVSGKYEIEKSGPAGCVLDGAMRDRDWVGNLAAGQHTLATSGTPCMVRRYYPPAARALIANRSWLPYYTPPELALPLPLLPQR
jgi:hypothetical protein